MGFRFIRRKKIAPGITLNLSKGGGSLSLGPRGTRVSAGTSGVRKTVGVPGTGLYYTERKSGRSSSKRSRGGRARSGTGGARAARPVPVEKKLTLGFFKRLFTPQEEEDLVDGLKAYVKGHRNSALGYFKKSLHLADAAFMAGFTALKMEKFEEAAEAFQAADCNHRRLGRYFSKYGISISLVMPITPEIAAHIGPTRRGLLLGLVEAYQEMEEYGKAVEVLERLRRSAPDDIAVKLSLAELLIEAFPKDRKIYDRVVRLAGDTENSSNIHAALMLYKGKALRGLGLPTAARDTLTAACRKRRDRSEELLKAIRYERARVYQEMGKKSRARSEFEKLYSADPGYEDVAERLSIRD